MSEQQEWLRKWQSDPYWSYVYSDDFRPLADQLSSQKIDLIVVSGLDACSAWHDIGQLKAKVDSIIQRVSDLEKQAFYVRACLDEIKHSYLYLACRELQDGFNCAISLFKKIVNLLHS